MPSRFITRCAYCKIEITTASRMLSHQRLATRDHVIPQCEGEYLFLRWSYALPPALRVRNWKWACAECNGLRAACGHCVGAMACVTAVAKSLKMRPNLVLRQWNRGYVMTKAELKERRAARRRRLPRPRFDGPRRTS